LIVQGLDDNFQSIGEPYVAADGILTAGPGDIVYIVSKKEAAFAVPGELIPIDECIVGYVEEYHVIEEAKKKKIPPKPKPEVPQPVEITPPKKEPEVPQPVEKAPLKKEPEVSQPVEKTPLKKEPEVPQPVEKTPPKKEPEVPQPVEKTPPKKEPEVPQPVEKTQRTRPRPLSRKATPKAKRPSPPPKKSSSATKTSKPKE